LYKYKLKTASAIAQKCDTVLKKYRTGDFFQYTISNDPIITYRNKKKGLHAENETPEKTAVVTDDFSVKLQFDQVVIDKELDRCWYYPLITNKPTDPLSIEEAMLAQ
jgi:aminopeptidase C